jgi:hypothetical protein
MPPFALLPAFPASTAATFPDVGFVSLEDLSAPINFISIIFPLQVKIREFHHLHFDTE